MMRGNWVVKIMVAGLLCASFGLLSAHNAAAGWYTCVINRITMAPGNGNVQFIVTPGTGETNFTGEGKLRVLNSAVGANKVLASLLTAQSMGWEVRLECAIPPNSAVQDMTTMTSPWNP
jgi:hypothetical protein